ncbi:hypothetical protein D3C73_661450 [compost metagenome]
MAHPGCGFIAGPGTAAADNCLELRQQFGLHEQLAERRVHGVTGGGRQHDFGIRGDFKCLGG